MSGGDRVVIFQSFQWGFELKSFSGKTIGEIGCSSNGFRQKMSGNFSFKHNGTGDLKKGTVFSFCNPILL